MHNEKDIIGEFERLMTRRQQLVESLCFRASYGRFDYSRDLQQECYKELIHQLPQRMENPDGRSEKAWVYWCCRSAIGHYLRRLRFHTMLPLSDRVAEVGEATHEVTALTVDEMASCLSGVERRCFLLLAEGADDNELQRQLAVSHRSIVQMKSNIKKKLYEYLNQ